MTRAEAAFRLNVTPEKLAALVARTHMADPGDDWGDADVAKVESHLYGQSRKHVDLDPDETQDDYHADEDAIAEEEAAPPSRSLALSGGA